jgi:hypothetical protein
MEIDKDFWRSWDPGKREWEEKEKLENQGKRPNRGVIRIPEKEGKITQNRLHKLPVRFQNHNGKQSPTKPNSKPPLQQTKPAANRYLQNPRQPETVTLSAQKQNSEGVGQEGKRGGKVRGTG